MFSRSLARHFFPAQRPRPSLSIRPLTRSITRIPIRSLFSRRLGRRLKEGEILLLIDEAQLMFNSRKWQNISRQGWLSFFSQHRHYGYPIKERVEGNFFVGSKKLFAIYDSYNHFDTPGQGQRVSGEKRGPTITLPLPAEEQKGEKKEEEDSGLEFIDLDKS
jgi:hypothetical protein